MIFQQSISFFKIHEFTLNFMSLNTNRDRQSLSWFTEQRQHNKKWAADQQSRAGSTHGPAHQAEILKDQLNVPLLFGVEGSFENVSNNEYHPEHDRQIHTQNHAQQSHPALHNAQRRSAINLDHPAQK